MSLEVMEGRPDIIIIIIIFNVFILVIIRID